MPRYYFDTHDGDIVRDDTGIECDNLQEVFALAMAGLADFAKEIVPGAKWQELAVKVRDSQDKPVMQAILRLEIDIPGKLEP